MDRLSTEDFQALNNLRLTVENMQLNYKNTILQLFIKYGLSMEDSIQPDGSILKAVPVSQKE